MLFWGVIFFIFYVVAFLIFLLTLVWVLLFGLIWCAKLLTASGCPRWWLEGSDSAVALFIYTSVGSCRNLCFLFLYRSCWLAWRVTDLSLWWSPHFLYGVCFSHVVCIFRTLLLPQLVTRPREPSALCTVCTILSLKLTPDPFVEKNFVSIYVVC